MTLLPAGFVYPTPTGIIFPSFLTANGINPASLGKQKGRAIELLYSPPPSGSNSHAYVASFATSQKKLGLGLSYWGSHNRGSLSHGAVVGSGFSFDSVAVGLGLRDPSIAGNYDPSVDFGLIGEIGNGTFLGGVLYGLDSTPVLDLGIGYQAGKKYHLEANIVFPQFSLIGKSNSIYILTLGTLVSAGVVSFSFQTSYYTVLKTFTHAVGGAVQVGEAIALTVQFISPASFTFGICVFV